MVRSSSKRTVEIPSAADMFESYKMMGCQLGIAKLADWCWKPGHLAAIAEDFFIALTELWNAILRQEVSIPRLWASARIAFIPEEDVTDERPLTISSACWRAGATAILRVLRPWILAWADASLLGGLRSRDARILYKNVFDCLSNADQHGLHMLLTKLDLQKAFDKVTINQALYLMTFMGAPGVSLCCASSTATSHEC